MQAQISPRIFYTLRKSVTPACSLRPRHRGTPVPEPSEKDACAGARRFRVRGVNIRVQCLLLFLGIVTVGPVVMCLLLSIPGIFTLVFPWLIGAHKMKNRSGKKADTFCALAFAKRPKAQ